MGGIAGGGVSLGTLSIAIEATVDEATRALQDFDAETGRIVENQKSKWASLGDIGQSLSSVGIGLSAAITAPLVALAAGSISAAGDLQALTMALNTLTGSSEETAIQMARLKEIARLPGLGLEEAVKGSLALQNVGIEAQTAERYLMAFGNAIAAAGGGKADLEAVVVQLRQMGATGKVTAEDLKPILERVPQVAAVTKEAFGTINTEELQKAGVTAEQFLGVVVTGLEKIPPVAGGIKNSLENLGDSAKQSLAKIGEALIPVLETVTPMIESFLGFIGDLATKFINLPGPVQAAIGILVGLAAAAGPLLLIAGQMVTAWAAIGPVLAVLGGTIGAFVAGLSAPVLAIAALVAALVAFGVWVYANWDAIVAVISGAWDGIMERWGPIINAIATVWDVIVEAWKIQWTIIIGAVVLIWDAWMAIIPAWWNGLVSIITAVWDTVSAIWTAEWNLIVGAVTAVWGAISTAVSTILTPLAALLTPLWDAAKAAWTGVWQTIESIVKPIWERLSAAADRVYSVVDKVAGFIPGLSDKFKTHADEADKAATATGKLATSTDDLKTSVKPAKTELEKMKEEIVESKRKADLHKQALKDLGFEVEETGKKHKTAKGELKQFNDEILIAKLQDYQAEHRKLVTEIAAYEIAARKGKDATADWFKDLATLNTNMLAAGGTINTIAVTQMPQLLTQLNAAITTTAGVDSAFKTLGITSSTEFAKVAAEAAKARDVVLGSDQASDFDKKTAVYKALQAQIAASKAAGIEIPADQAKLLGDLKTELETKVPEMKAPFEGLATSVSTVITNFAQDISKSLWDGDTSWGEKGKSLLKSLGQAVTSSFIEPAAAAIGNFIKGALADLLGGKGFGGVWDSIKGIGGSVGGIFGGGGGGAKPSIPGGGAAGGIGGAVSGAAGWIGAISGAVSAVSGIIGNFQMKGMNETLALIEELTRYSMIHLFYILDKLNEYIPGIKDIHDYLYEHQIKAFGELIFEAQHASLVLDRLHYQGERANETRYGQLEQMIAGIERIALGTERQITMNLNGSDPEIVAARIAQQLRLQGASG